MATSPERIPVDLKPGRYKIAWISVLALFPIVWVLRDLLGGIHIGDTTIWYSYLIMFLLLLYYVASIKKVETYELGGIIVLEKEAKEVTSGYKFVPLGLCEMPTYPRAPQQNHFPGEPEKISKKPDDEELRTDMLKPIRATTAEGKPEDGDILSSRLTLEPTVTVRWQIQKKGFFEFYINIPGVGWNEKKAYLLQIMRDAVEKALTHAITSRTPAQVNAQRPQIAEEIIEKLEDATETWGIFIIEINVLNLDPGHDINIALEQIPIAKADARTIEIRATARRLETILAGEGAAIAREAILTAEGKGLSAAAAALGITAEDYRAGEIAKATIGEGTLIIGDDGIVKALGIGAAILKKGGTK